MIRDCFIFRGSRRLRLRRILGMPEGLRGYVYEVTVEKGLRTGCARNRWLSVAIVRAVAAVYQQPAVMPPGWVAHLRSERAERSRLAKRLRSGIAGPDDRHAAAYLIDPE